MYVAEVLKNGCLTTNIGEYSVGIPKDGDIHRPVFRSGLDGGLGTGRVGHESGRRVELQRRIAYLYARRPP
jgi:hypothetical protein